MKRSPTLAPRATLKDDAKLSCGRHALRAGALAYASSTCLPARFLYYVTYPRAAGLPCYAQRVPPRLARYLYNVSSINGVASHGHR